MRKIKILLLIMLLAGVISNGYTESQGYEKLVAGLKKMANSFAIANAVTLLHAGTWNTAYIGQITDVKFGLGFNTTLGISNIGSLWNNKLAKDMQNLDFSTIPGFGLATPFSIRLGGFGGVPIDFGLYFAYVPYDKLFNTKKTGLADFSSDALTLGFDTRYAVLGKDSNFAISVGLAYLYQRNNTKYTIKNINLSEEDVEKTPVTIGLSDVGMKFDFSTHTVGLRAQLSKAYLFDFLEVSLALEPFFTVSNFTVKTSGDLTVKTKDREEPWKYSEYVSKIAAITGADFVKNGHIDFNHTPINGGLRLYLGNSIKLWVLYLDTNIGYEPFSSTVLASLGIRIGL